MVAQAFFSASQRLMGHIDIDGQALNSLHHCRFTFKKSATVGRVKRRTQDRKRLVVLGASGGSGAAVVEAKGIENALTSAMLGYISVIFHHIHRCR